MVRNPIFKNTILGKGGIKFFLFICVILFSLQSCSKVDKQNLPEETPRQVVEKFYSYLKKGGKRTLVEAQRLTVLKESSSSARLFRNWTVHYHADTEVIVLESRILDKPAKDGSTIAEVQMSVKVPSTFGGFHETTSLMHLILDKETNSWKIDFFAETVDEENFKRQQGGK